MFDRIKVLYRVLVGPYKTAIKKGMKVGKNVTVMGGCNFGSEPYLITLHDNVRISNNVSFITHDGGNYTFRHWNGYEEVNHFGKIIVDEYTFIGANATIMPGVRIGKNCCIGVGAVVTKSIPDNCVVAGVPARIMMTTHEYAEKMKSRMPEDWDTEEYKKSKKEYLLRTIASPKE